MPLDIQIKRTMEGPAAGTITVEVNGTLDAGTSPALETKLSPILGNPVKTLIFDLGKLSFISSAGLRVLLASYKKVKADGGQASFVNMQPQIREVFDIIQALPGVAVFKDMAELDAYLARRQNEHQG